MNRFFSKKTLAICILIGGVVFAWSIVHKKNTENSAFELSLETKRSDRLSFKNDGSPHENTKQNLTDAAIAKYLNEIVSRNPNGPQNNTIKLPSQDILESTLASVSNTKIQYTPITEDDIRISKETGTLAETAYIKAAQEADKEISKKVDVSELSALYSFFSQNESGPLVSYIDGLQSLTSNLIATPVPESMKDFHIKLINLQIKKTVLFKNFLDMENDPLKVIVAIKEYEQLPEEEHALATVIAKKM